MEATRPKMMVLGDSSRSGGAGVGQDLHYAGSLGISAHPCEYCKCCSCQKVCTKCRSNCSPADSLFIPVIGCPEFADMHTASPIRYLYRNGYGREFRVHLPRSR